MKKIAAITLFLLSLAALTLGLSACTCPNRQAREEAAAPAPAAYISITQQEAKTVMDRQEGAVILDVRTQEEYEEAHIAGAVLIPHDQIADQAPSLLPDKEQTLLVYCRSGNRSKTAAQALADLGYSDVREFGGISTWEYGTVQ